MWGFVGALLGASIALLGQFMLEQRRVDRDARTAARLQGEDYWSLSVALLHTLESGEWWPTNLAPTSVTEPGDRRLVLLACSPELGRRVFGALRRANQTVKHREEATGPPSKLQLLNALAAYYDVEAAREDLSALHRMGFNRRDPNRVAHFSELERDQARMVADGKAVFAADGDTVLSRRSSGGREVLPDDVVRREASALRNQAAATRAKQGQVRTLGSRFSAAASAWREPLS